MYIHRKRHTRKLRNRCTRKNAKIKAKNKRRKLRKSGLPH